MKKLLVALLAVSAPFTVGACAHKNPKSTAHIYAGDAPTIKYMDKPESAGGRIQSY